MTFPVVDAVGEAGASGNSTSTTVTLPTHASGNHLLVAIALDGGATLSTATSGWSEVLQRNLASDAVGVTLAVYEKVAASASETNPVFTHSSEKAAYRVYVISGSNGAADGSSAVDDTGSTTTSNPPSHSATFGAEDILWFAFGAHDGAQTFSAHPYGAGNHGNINATGSGPASLAYDYKAENDSSEDPGTFTGSANFDWVAATVAVYPADSPGAPQEFDGTSTAFTILPWTAEVGLTGDIDLVATSVALSITTEPLDFLFNIDAEAAALSIAAQDAEFSASESDPIEATSTAFTLTALDAVVRHNTDIVALDVALTLAAHNASTEQAASLDFFGRSVSLTISTHAATGGSFMGSGRRSGMGLGFGRFGFR